MARKKKRVRILQGTILLPLSEASKVRAPGDGKDITLAPGRLLRATPGVELDVEPRFAAAIELLVENGRAEYIGPGRKKAAPKPEPEPEPESEIEEDLEEYDDE